MHYFDWAEYVWIFFVFYVLVLGFKGPSILGTSHHNHNEFAGPSNCSEPLHCIGLVDRLDDTL